MVNRNSAYGSNGWAHLGGSVAGAGVILADPVRTSEHLLSAKADPG
jgi:hypothetical protein